MISRIYHMGRRDPRVIDDTMLSDAVRELWHGRGDVFVRADEVRTMPSVVRLALEAFAIGKWGKRKQA